MNFWCCRCWLQQMCHWNVLTIWLCGRLHSILHYWKLSTWYFGDNLLPYAPNYSTSTRLTSLCFHRKTSTQVITITKITLDLMQSSYCWRAFNHCAAFHMLGVSWHCGDCKCISSMPNVCCAGHHWFSHKFDNDNYFLFSSRVCLKEQLSIFTTQALLELPKVARSSHGNTSFIPGLSPLAGILLIHYCLVSLQPVFTCLLLICIQLYILTETSCVWTRQIDNVHLYTTKAVFDTLCFWNMRWTVMPQWTLILWSSLMKYTHSDYSMPLE